MALKIVILKGLPGSGKSTWARTTAKNSDYIRVNKDDIRQMLYGDSKRKGWHEGLVLSVRDSMIFSALSHKKNVIVDDTNLNPIHEKRIRQIAEDFVGDVEVEVKEFNTPLQECIANDLKRDRSVGETVIRQMHNQYIRPTLHVEQNPDNPDAVIFDLDGTLALMGDRNPYDASECEYDKLNYPVYEALKRYEKNGYKIIVLSGRSGEYFAQTARWLEKHSIHPDLFVMRSVGDNRKDNVVKREMFMNHVFPNYHVDAVYDDREQVVTMWRDLGLTCFQVADGRF